VPAATGLVIGRDLLVTSDDHILVLAFQNPGTAWEIRR
jgi:hypothetical protein